jgi:hypothetical protein
MNYSPDSHDSDVTLDPIWQLRQMDRLLAWEILQNALGGGNPEISERVLADRLAMPAGFWHVIIKKIKRRPADVE